MGDPHMIPGADMFNHDPDKQSVQMSTDGEDHFVMKTVGYRRQYEYFLLTLIYFVDSVHFTDFVGSLRFCRLW